MGFFGFGKKNKEKEQEKMKTGLEKTRTGYRAKNLHKLTRTHLYTQYYE